MTENGKPQLSVFKGRGAKLNKAILLILCQESPLNIRQVYKKVRALRDLQHARYRVVNRRMKSLEYEGYVEWVRTERTPQGFIAKLYQITFKAYLAFLFECTSLEKFINYATESDIVSILAVLSNTLKP